MRRLISNSANIHRVVFGVIVVCVLGTAANGTPWEGNGTAEQPYLIFDACDMQAIGADSNYWDAHFKLMADIDLSAYTGSSFNIIGGISPDPCLGYLENPFTGVFDGNGHIISNFSFKRVKAAYVGLFGYVDDSNAEIRNVGVVAADVNTEIGLGYYIAAVAGYLESGSITGCYVKDSKVYGGYYVGGIVGQNIFGEIQDCNLIGTIVIGDYYVGGLIGDNGGSVSNCYSRDISVSMEGHFGGGLVGYNEGTISQCYTRGSTIAGVGGGGGLVGRNDSAGIVLSCYSGDNIVTGSGAGGLVSSNVGTISNCHSDCFVKGRAGLVGYDSGNISKCYSVSRCVGTDYGIDWIEDCFWNNEIAGDGYQIGIGLSTEEMMTAEPYVVSGWDFTTPVWTIDEGNDYPRLWWEKIESCGRYGGGRGLPAEPYLIYTAEDMQAIGANQFDWHKHFRLMADIDLGGYSGTEFNIIGKFVGVGSASNIPFIGGFDGAGHTISNFTYSSNGNYIGIFKYIERRSVIKNLGLIDPNVDGGDYVAPLVARHYGTITNCYAEGGIVSGNISVGGLVGNSLGEVSRCYSTASVVGEGYVGGLAGLTADAGGPAGRGKVLDCYSWGDVSGGIYVGGLVGRNYESLSYYPAEISNCYAAGSVFGDSDVGGLIGKNDGDAYNCFWDVNSSGQSSSAGGEGKTTVEMQTMSTFTDAGWDFVGEVINGLNDIWAICDGTNYPKLSWQRPPVGDFVCPDGVEINDLAILCGQWLLEELSRDVWPEGGDGIVNFLDWAVFADQWQTTVDYDDLADFAEQWLGRVLLADVWPGYGDLFVNFSDWALFANAWQSTPESPNWDRRCDIAPAGGDEIVDIEDIGVFMQQWLTAGSYYPHLDADIAPATSGDGLVNMLDFAALANNWLAGVSK